MVTEEEFEALKKRVGDLEEMMAEIPQTLHTMMDANKAVSGLADKLPLVMEQLSTLATAVAKLQDKHEGSHNIADLPRHEV